MAKPLIRPTTQSIASYVRKRAPAVKRAQKEHHMSSTSVREAQYQGHHIVIRTTYSVEVDGVRLMGHMGVSNDGSVHYHPIPNMRFDSAIDLVKQIIYVFPDDFSGRSSMGHRGSMNMSGMKHKGGAKTHKTRKK